MKSRINILTIFLFFCTTISYSQNYSNDKSNCDNYNSFLNELDNNFGNISKSIEENGVIRINKSKIDHTFNHHELILKISKDSDISYTLVRESKSRGNSNLSYKKYQQYYKDYKVEGGGYTVGIPSDDPCEQASIISPYILTDIEEMKLTSKIDEHQLIDILKGELGTENISFIKNTMPELIISHNLQNDCNYLLNWKVQYNAEGKSYVARIDAIKGGIVTNIRIKMGLTSSSSYSTERKSKLDFTESKLINVDPNGDILFYDLSGEDCGDDISTDDIDDDFTPICPQTSTDPLVIQSFSLLNDVILAFNNLGIQFGTLHVGLNCNEDNGFALCGSDLDEGYIVFGQDANGVTTAVCDFIGHELGHVFLNEYFPYETWGQQSIHEGVADVLGIYAEETMCGGTNWRFHKWRNLANPHPNFDCFLEIDGTTASSGHLGGVSIGAWYHTIATGDIDEGIAALGMDVPVNLILDALELLPENSDPFDLGVAIMSVAQEMFDPCSDELLAIGRSLRKYCIYYPFNGCHYHINGPREVCEEVGHFTLSIDNITSGANYRWSFPMAWDVANSSPTSNQYNGTTLIVNSIPQYNYYPQTFEICVYSPTLGTEFKECIEIIILDCDGLDPDCETFHSNDSILDDTNAKNNSFSSPKLKNNDNIDFHFMAIHDVLGIKIYEGVYDENVLKKVTKKNKLYVISYFNVNKTWIKSEKRIF